MCEGRDFSLRALELLDVSGLKMDDHRVHSVEILLKKNLYFPSVAGNSKTSTGGA